MNISLEFIIAALIAITVHEFAHGWVANHLGDPTAKYEGRLTLNPIRHLDLMGALMFFLIGIGWAKPVPINPANFRNPKLGMVLTSLAGPGANVLTAVIFAIPYKYFAFSSQFLGFSILAETIFSLNLLLCVFNLLPFPPLDGSKILAIFIPQRYEYAYFNYLRNGVKYFAIFLIFDVFIFGRLTGHSLLMTIIGTGYHWLAYLILLGT